MKLKNTTILMFCVSLMLMYPLCATNTSKIKLLSSETNEELPHISVWLGDLAGKTAKRYTTNSDGEIINHAKEKMLLTIKQIGYKPLIDTIEPSESKQLYLEADVFNLEQVVVTATRTDKTLKESPVITQVITEQQIAEQGITDIKELLTQEMPGLNFQDNGPMGMQVNSQGLTAKNILFLIDGERIAGEKSDNIDYMRLNLNNIERIEIIKGAASALYGSQAMGGVINIITKEAEKPFEMSVGANYMNMNQRNFTNVAKSDNLYNYKRNVDKQNLNANLSFGFNIDKFKSYTDIAYQSVDGYQLYNTEGESKYYPEYDTTINEAVSESPMSVDGNENINISEKLSYQLTDALQLSAKGRFFNLNKYDFTKDYSYEHDIDFSYGAAADYVIDENSSLQVNFYADNYRRYSQSERTDANALIYKNNLIQPRAVYNTKAFNEQQITAGIEYLSEMLYADRFVSAEYGSKTQWNSTFFVQDDWNVMDNLNIIPGLRLDYHKEYGFNASPKVSVKQNIEPLTLRLNYAMGYRSPTLKELYMNWDHQGMFQILGSVDLLPETNNYLSFSAEYVSSWLYLTASTYCNWFKNKIDGTWENNETIFQYANIGKTTLAGVEGNAKVKLYDGLFLNAAIDYLYLQESENIAMSIASPLSATLKLEYALYKTDYKLNITASASYRGSKNYAVSDDLLINSELIETYYEINAPAFVICRLAVSQTFYNSLKLTLGVNNLLNYKPGIFNFNSSTTPGRRYCVSLSYKL